MSKKTASELMDEAREAIANDNRALSSTLALHAINESDDFNLSQAFRNHATDLMQAGLFREAIPYLTKAIELNPTSIHPLYSRAIAYGEIGEWSLSVKDLDGVLRMNPSYADALIQKISALAKLQDRKPRPIDESPLASNESFDSDEMIFCLNRLIELQPDNPTALTALGVVLFNRTEFRLALLKFKEAIDVGEDSDKILYEIGLCELFTDDFIAGLESLKSFICREKLHEANKEKLCGAYYYLGRIYEIEENSELAIASYRLAIEEPEGSMFGKALVQCSWLLLDVDISSSIEYLNLALSMGIPCFDQLNYAQNIQANRPVMDACIDIIKLLEFKGDSVTHYTSLSTASILSGKQATVRLSSTESLNDPTEGLVLNEWLKHKKVKSESASPAFVVSFSTKADSLDLWRMYGKHADTEGAGSSLTVSPDIAHSIGPFYERQDDLFRKIYRVAYYDETTRNFYAEGASEDALTSAFSKLKSATENIEPEALGSISLFNKICHLVKSHHYQSENECRLILMERPLDQIKIDETGDVPRVYIELDQPAIKHLQKITIGPNAVRPEEWRVALQTKLKKNIPIEEQRGVSVEISQVPFR